ncbi:proton-conducting transporter membrane subunit [Consotaella salsifontis]|uniref:Formate hydrogenlyase subunit 3/Multisubunit Na+/H+ antiporter, MnhD subunit n=1 Tax=Consotaella salsifontis TaxID=1365950 RepID=A0A1T4SIS9_9HYPH|nr:proton-conducting transporter membrane subunit [Consotaella salsifontis]SKA28066.1 Formate hydrogenlyase subunit 3/Multisubunit Na+/H+ antiporter, MnhD subunit [Consotaella salsifontis]
MLMLEGGQLAWLGAILLLFGEIAALMSLPNLPRVVIVSTIAEVGYVLMGLGLGGAAGDTGAFMHIGFQVVMRGLVVVTGWYLIARTGSSNLDDLAGSGRRMPLMTTLFGFGMFSVMGLSPFKGSFSKFLILYAAIEQGRWMLAAIGTLASIIAAVYYMLVIQKVCFQRPDRRVEMEEVPAGGAKTVAYVLAAITIAISLFPHPFQHLAESFAGVGGKGLVPEFESPWASLVLVPYVGGFVIYAIGHYLPRWRDGAAVLLSLVTLGLVVIDTSLDPTSRLFALLFAAIAAVMIVYSVGYMARTEWTNRYYFFAFLMIGSMLGLTTAHELGNFYVYWELMTWTSYFLVIQEQTQKALKAGLIYFLMCAAGAYVMHFGILVVHAEIGSFEFAALAEKAADFPLLTGALASACFFVGFAVKAGLVPFQAWLPIAHPQAPSSVSGPLSGILTKAGFFGIAKVLFSVIGLSALSRFALKGIDLPTVLLVLGCATLIYGEVRALLEKELKRMLAFSTLAQIGEIAAILGLGTALATDAALLHITNHAVMKTLLFYAAGAFILRTGLRRIDDLAGLGRKMPVTAGLYALASVAIMGLPPFSGFVSKFLMVYAAVEAGNYLVAALLLLGGIIGVVYYTRVVSILFYRSYKGPETVKDAPLSMLVAMGALGLAIVLGGLFPNWQLALVNEAGSLIAARGGLEPALLPNLVTEWPASAALAMIGAIAVLFTGRWSVKWAGRLAVAVTIAALAALLLDAGRMDLLSLSFAVLIAGVGALNLMHATAYLAHSHAQGRFFAAFLVMIAGLLGMTTARNLFTFFAFWELMSSWALWAAIVHEETEEARREGFKYFLFNTVGASFLFLGVTLLAAETGTFELGALTGAVAALPVAKIAPAVGLILLGFVMKAAQLPIRIDWQMHPAAAPTPVSGYISAVLLKAGPWAVLKFAALLGGTAALARLGGTVPGTFGEAGAQPVLLYIVSVIAGVTIVYAGAMAVLQNGIKLLLIYSTVCQLGYVLLALSLGTSLGVAGGLMHLVNHMLLKDTLFLVAGAVMMRNHATTLDELGGLGRRMPLTFGFFLFAGLSLAGIPPLNGFTSKWLIFEAAFQSGHWLLGAAAMFSSLLTLAAVLKFAHAAFMGAPTARALEAEEAPLAMLLPMATLCGASLLVGLMPGLLLVPIAAIQAELGMAPIAATLTGPLPGVEGFNPGALAILALVLGLISLAWLSLGRRGRIVRTAIHTSGADLAAEDTRLPAASLYDLSSTTLRHVRDLGGLIPANTPKDR